MTFRPPSRAGRAALAARTRSKGAPDSSHPTQDSPGPSGEKEMVEIPEDDEDEDEKLRKEEDEKAEERVKKRGAKASADKEQEGKKRKYKVRMEEGFDVEEMVDQLLEGHNDLMNLKDILASAPKLRDELKARLSRRLVASVRLWAETGTKMDWKSVACGCLDIVVKGKTCTTMVDTGAEMNLIKEEHALRLGMEIDRSDNGVLMGANSRSVFIGTASRVVLEIGKVKVRSCFFVMPDLDHPILLGRSFLSRTEIVILNKHDGTMFLVLCDPVCGNYEVITCKNTGLRSIRNRPNLDSFTIEESEEERKRLGGDEFEEERSPEALTLSLTNIGDAMDIVSTYGMADMEVVEALREKVMEQMGEGEVELVEGHERSIGGIYLLANALLQDEVARIGDQRQGENENVVHKGEDDDFEEGEIKEAFRTEEYDGIYLELGMLLSLEMRERDACEFVASLVRSTLDTNFWAAMPRGRGGAGPVETPLGVTRQGTQMRARREDRSPIYIGDNVKLFMVGFKRHGHEFGWDSRRLLQEVQGAGEWAQPLANFVRESLTWQDFERKMEGLHPSPLGRDGQPIRFDVTNLWEFLKGYDEFADSINEPPSQRKELERQDKEMEAMKTEVEKAWGGNEAIRQVNQTLNKVNDNLRAYLQIQQNTFQVKEAKWEKRIMDLEAKCAQQAPTAVVDWTEVQRFEIRKQPAKEVFKCQKVEVRANEQKDEEIPLLDKEMLQTEDALARMKSGAGGFEWRMPTVLAHEARPPSEDAMDEAALSMTQEETVGRQEVQESVGQAMAEAEEREEREVSQKTPPSQDMPLVAGGTCTVQYLRRWHPKGTRDERELTKILRNPTRIEEWKNKDAAELFRLYRGAKSFQKKLTRSYLRRLVSRTIKNATGWVMGAHVNVKLKYNDRVKVVEVRKLTNDKLLELDLPTCMMRRARSKLKIVWTSNPTVSDLLHNQKTFAHADVCTCTCAGLPYPRIGDHVRFRLQELGDIDPTLCNAKNVPRASLPNRSKLLQEEIEEAFGTWQNQGAKMIQISEHEAERCMMNNNNTDTRFLDVTTVMKLRERLDGLICTPLDRNTGETLVLCPLLYHEAMMTTFVCNTGNRIMDCDESTILAMMKADVGVHDLRGFVKMEKKGTLDRAYVQPNHKDLDRYRPICPSYCEPTVRTSRVAAKALNHVLFAMPESWHFNTKAGSDLVPRIDKINKKIQKIRRGDSLVSSMSYDIKDMFSKLPHENIMEALNWIIDYFVSKGKRMVRVNPRGKGSSFGQTTGADHWQTIDLETLKRFVEFDLKHTYTTATGVILKQEVGIPMGKSTSPPLACIMCAYAAVNFISSLGHARSKVFGIRLIDDVSLITVTKKDDKENANHIREQFEHCYPSNLTLKRTDDGGGKWEFLGLEMRQRNTFPYVESVQLSKNERSVWTDEGLEFKNGQSYRSWGSKGHKSAVITSRLHRIDRNTTVRSEFPDRVLTVSRELRLMEFPTEFFLRVLKRFATGREPIWQHIWTWLSSDVSFCF
ncbi:hypothetical protein CBR_g33961 [Chara braunii]|uniref:Reverse transcriptase domain-containing protein n=1 Tax=Chara braunii TaxID=69332 RepID=A0A388LHR8_CHABU|nr:hypothetical protein CBR_g33961 [Chara braunii]|eukprot:GBG81783.1 hypothetical protein CBR_g33961 [Chara braunii]